MMMKFITELQAGDRIIKDVVILENLSQLHEYLKEKYPTNKILSILGGGAE